jgi:hypothetical protein
MPLFQLRNDAAKATERLAKDAAPLLLINVVTKIFFEFSLCKEFSWNLTLFKIGAIHRV